jgi:putative flippase GtrA
MKLQQAFRYLVVGGWNTVFGIGLYAAAYSYFKSTINYLVLLILCNIIAITNAYICYKFFVFKTTGNWLREYLRFYIVYGASILISFLLVAFFVQVLKMHPVRANILSTAITVVLSFVGHKRISFEGSDNETRGP